MKLILVNSLANGGAERIAVNIANEVIKTEPIILATLESNVEYDVAPKVEVIHFKNHKYFRTFFHILELIKIIKKRKVNFVQSHLYRSNIINVATRLIGGNQFSQIVNHGDPLQYRKKGVKGIIMLSFIKIFYPKADQIIAISDLMNKNISNLIKKNNKHKILTINNPNNIDSIIKQSMEHCDILEKLNFKYLVAMGRLINSKNFDLLIKGIEKQNINLVIIGDGPEKDYLEKLAKKLNISERVFFLGKLKNPFPIIRNAFAFISASSSEGFPNSIIESLACSTPVIHTDCVSGPREILQPNSNLDNVISISDYEITQYGTLYRVGDIIGLVNSINYISNLSVERINNLCHNCKLRAYDFDSSIIVKKYFRQT
ncbi:MULTISPECIES: glycosyltransferase [unclassified Providencia]|uniref:glycosyltransferase n=1 Tax=unclassified Providencia TaxID=2633465 RepID=UPI00298F84C0|nr:MULTISPECIES: glycosyltransferase [unclassified Providencia]